MDVEDPYEFPYRDPPLTIIYAIIQHLIYWMRCGYTEKKQFISLIDCFAIYTQEIIRSAKCP